MKHFQLHFVIIPLLLFSPLVFCQGLEHNFTLIEKKDSPGQIIKKAANITPSKVQYDWQRLEMTGFIHFGINTFNDVEWGAKDIDISPFNPKEINVKQWVKTFKDAGIKLIILTTKHHDGFCLWPSKYTDFNISQTPYNNGKGDIVRDLSDACREAGLKFGVYLSPWDMHEKTYGSDAYNEHFRNQLNELLSNYGEISEVWFDGACGEGPNGKKQIYDWHSYYEVIRRLQPKAAIAVSGPDVRWVGTESGYGRKTEWSVVPGANLDQDAIAASSQQNPVDGGFSPHDLMDEDLGSREKISKASSLVWYPAETDVSIRPGWFYHSEDDSLVSSPYKLVDIYYNSVGMNSVLLLNVPPDKRGIICDADIRSLKGMRYLLDETFKKNMIAGAKIKASSELKGNGVKNIADDKYSTYWSAAVNADKAVIELKLKGASSFNTAMLQENILRGQRIEKFRLEYKKGNQWVTFAEGTTVGYKRLLRFPEVKTDMVRIVIDESRTEPALSSFGLYMAPPEIKFEPKGSSFAESTEAKMSCDVAGAKIYYTTDGSVPNDKSKLYSGSIKLDRATILKAVAVAPDGKKGLPAEARFNKAIHGIEYKTMYDKSYPAAGIYTLVDGVAGSKNFRDGKWQGFAGKDVETVIDLGSKKQINQLSARFLQDIGAGIFMPESVEYSVSDDGSNFSGLCTVKNDIPQNQKKITINPFIAELKNTNGRYIKVKAKSIGKCPSWSISPGQDSWIFADEFSAE